MNRLSFAVRKVEVFHSKSSLLSVIFSGKINYFTQPPEQHTLPTHVSASLVTEMGREFSLDDIMEVEEKALQGIVTVCCIISLRRSAVLLVLNKGKLICMPANSFEDIYWFMAGFFRFKIYCYL